MSKKNGKVSYIDDLELINDDSDELFDIPCQIKDALDEYFRDINSETEH